MTNYKCIDHLIVSGMSITEACDIAYKEAVLHNIGVAFFFNNKRIIVYPNTIDTVVAMYYQSFC